ncbi:hypothetical protein ACQRIT_001477 [Beauveria bassiana]
MSVKDCRELVEAMLQQEFEGSGMEATTIVYKNAEEIIKTSKMGLWAHSAVQESVVINMRMPGIKRFLRNLAEMGVGVTAEYQGVLYKFVPTYCGLDWPKWEWVVTWEYQGVFCTKLFTEYV